MPSNLNVVGKPISTAENAATIPGVSQRFRLPATKPNSLLQGVGLGLVFHDSIYANLSVELWADRAGSPSLLLATSQTVWTKAQVDAAYPLDYKLLWIGFQFTPFPLRRETWYHLALRAGTYTGDDTNHIAWLHAYPDVIYGDALGFDIEAIKSAVVPLSAAVFAAEF